jgi:hypothetical protein
MPEATATAAGAAGTAEPRRQDVAPPANTPDRRVQLGDPGAVAGTQAVHRSHRLRACRKVAPSTSGLHRQQCHSTQPVQRAALGVAPRDGSREGSVLVSTPLRHSRQRSPRSPSRTVTEPSRVSPFSCPATPRQEVPTPSTSGKGVNGSAVSLLPADGRRAGPSSSSHDAAILGCASSLRSDPSSVVGDASTARAWRAPPDGKRPANQMEILK